MSPLKRLNIQYPTRNFQCPRAEVASLRCFDYANNNLTPLGSAIFSEIGDSLENQTVITRTANTKYVVYRQDAKVSYEQLFDLEKDPWEMKNQIGNPKYQQVLGAMREKLDRWEKETKTVPPLQAGAEEDQAARSGCPEKPFNRTVPKETSIMKLPLCFHTIILLSAITAFCSEEGIASETGTRPLLGVQRWDMYSGRGTTQQQELGYLPGKQGFLKDPEWHGRAPFFCRLTADVDWVAHPEQAGPLWFNHPFNQALLQRSMDQEIRYAHSAGIDFFIYNGPTRTLFANAWELKNNLDCHMASKIPEAQSMKFVWALYGHSVIHYTRTKVAVMMDETKAYVKMDNWQTVMDDRPLVIVLWPGQFRLDLEDASGEERMTGCEFVEYVRARVKAEGLKNPYMVGATVPARSYEQADSLKKDGYDAFMDYAGGYGGKAAERDKAPTYAVATAELVNTYESKFLKGGLPFIPPCTSMQYPWPRALDHQTGKPKKTWYHYQWPKQGDLADRVKAAFDFVAAHPKACEAQVVTMYSWNEHSEGGGLCPTMGTPPEYKPVTQWLDEVAAALAAWHYPMQAMQEN